MNNRTRAECNLCMNSCTPGQMASCLFCEYEVCKPCARRWLLSLNEDPSCMNCHRPFNHDALTQLFGATFVRTEWKRQRENVLLDRETAMLPETQPFVRQELQRRENKKRIAELEAERNDLKRQLRETDRAISDIHNADVPVQIETERREFVQRCARTGCEGFLQHTWRCRKCNGDTCKDCGVFKGDTPEAHVCKDEDKASMELIRKDSRRCVACGAWTFKIHGCNQMYCVAPGCNTAWDWRTGKKVTGVIHNPEYFRMQRELNILGRNINDIPCGGAPTLTEIYSKWRPPCVEYNKVSGLLRLISHINLEEIPRYPDRAEAHDNRDLRILFTLSEISNDDLKVRLQQREKKQNKLRDINMMLTMFVTTVSDIMRQMIIDPFTMLTRYEEVLQLIRYFNREVGKIASRYQCVVPSIYTMDITGGYWRMRTSRWVTNIQEDVQTNAQITLA